MRVKASVSIKKGQEEGSLSRVKAKIQRNRQITKRGPRSSKAEARGASLLAAEAEEE